LLRTTSPSWIFKIEVGDAKDGKALNFTIFDCFSGRFAVIFLAALEAYSPQH
jgi:hypothetical protein